MRSRPPASRPGRACDVHYPVSARHPLRHQVAWPARAIGAAREAFRRSGLQVDPCRRPRCACRRGYLPYIIVDGKASADVAGQGEIETRRYERGSDNNKTTYYDADVYRLNRHVDFTVDDLPLESSATRGDFDTRVNTNNIINAILPFDTKNAVKWNASYLAGFSSEKRDLNVEGLRPRLED